MMETSAMGIVFGNGRGDIHEANAAFAQLSGYTREELSRVGWKTLLPLDLKEFEDRARMELERMGTFGQADVECLRKDGKRIPVSVSLAKLQAEGEEIVAFVQDISERMTVEKAARVSRELLDQALTAARMVAWRRDLGTNRVTHLGDEEVLGLNNPQCLGTGDDFYSLIYEEDRARVREAVDNAILSQKNWKAEFRLLRQKDRRMIWVEDHGNVRVDKQGKSIGIGGVLFDISERKLAEQKALIRSEQLTRSNKELEQFAYVASHDLKEPLRTVANYAQLLALRYRDKLDAQGELCIRFVTEGTRRMYSLIDDLLEYSRAGREDAPLEKVDCTELLGGVLRHLQDSITESGAQITYDVLPLVVGDSRQLIQLFQNILGNAIKYRSEREPVIHIGVSSTEKEHVFHIRDNGIGIEHKHFDKIFVLFQRLHGGEVAPTGTGIGLAICKRILLRHGGQIWLESQPGSGTTFYFNLPNQTLGESAIWFEEKRSYL